ncbi:MAG: hypothetical protein ACJAVO_000621 [Parvibaculaceae bacterium]|mgnify:CR=1 FL=1|jgi:hypothetical protein
MRSSDAFNTGPLGGLWTFKNNADHREWNVGFSSHASALAAYGYHGTKDRIEQGKAFWFKAWDKTQPTPPRRYGV